MTPSRHMSCQEVTDLFWLHLYGELTFDQDESVEQHLAACPDCSDRLQREIELHGRLESAAPALPPGLLTNCRQDLFRRVRAERSAVAEAGFGRGLRRILRSLTTVDSSWTAAAWKPAGALALVALGFFGGRWSPPASSTLESQEAAASVATRVRAVEHDPNGQVRVIVEDTRRRAVAGLPSDEVIRGLLLSAAQDPADPGLRVDSIDMLRRESETIEVRRALMVALEADPNPGVRMKALEGLRPFAGDAEVRRSLAHVLLRDDHSGLRTQAVDMLIQSKPHDMVGVLQQLMQHEENGYIRLRTQRALREMNASVDTF